MEWILHDYIHNFVLDYEKISQEQLEEKLFNGSDPVNFVNPVDWTSINLQNLSPHSRSRDPNLGFLFRATGDVVNNIEGSKQQFPGQSSTIPALHPNEPVIIKCLSAVLDVRYDKSGDVMKGLVDGRLAAERAKAAERLAKAAERENAKLRQMLKDKGQLVAAPGEMKPETAIPMSGDSEPPLEPPPDIEEEICIKHPYLGMGMFDSHPVLIMRDMGDTLQDILRGSQSEFGARWRRDPALRDAFRRDIGLTALNLVSQSDYCHNDIRPPNIAYSLSDNRFCLLDFDMSRTHIQFQEDSVFSPNMVAAASWKIKNERMMCYSVAQIAVNVFILDSTDLLSADEVSTAAKSIWSTVRDGSPVDVEFEAWAEAKGVLHFISAVREACFKSEDTTSRERQYVFPANFMGYFIEVLHLILA
jgi:hypothetical protein